MNWNHRIPRKDKKIAHRHDTSWPKDGKSSCQCGATVNEETRTVQHRSIKDE